jgi:hypothetical protein
MGLAQYIDAAKDAGVQHLWPLCEPDGETTVLDFLGSVGGTLEGSETDPVFDASGPFGSTVPNRSLDMFVGTTNGGYVSFGTNEKIRPYRRFSGFMWVYIGASTSGPLLGTIDESAADAGFEFAFWTGNRPRLRLRKRDNTVTDIIESSSIAGVTGEWNFLAWSYHEDGTYLLRVNDDVEQGSTTAGALECEFATAELRLNKAAGKRDWKYAGLGYSQDRTLTNAQLTAIKEAGESTTQAYWYRKNLGSDLSNYVTGDKTIAAKMVSGDKVDALLLGDSRTANRNDWFTALGGSYIGGRASSTWNRELTGPWTITLDSIRNHGDQPADPAPTLTDFSGVEIGAIFPYSAISVLNDGPGAQTAPASVNTSIVAYPAGIANSPALAGTPFLNAVAANPANLKAAMLVYTSSEGDTQLSWAPMLRYAGVSTTVPATGEATYSASPGWKVIETEGETIDTSSLTAVEVRVGAVPSATLDGAAKTLICQSAWVRMKDQGLCIKNIAVSGTGIGNFVDDRLLVDRSIFCVDGDYASRFGDDIWPNVIPKFFDSDSYKVFINALGTNDVNNYPEGRFYEWCEKLRTETEANVSGSKLLNLALYDGNSWDESDEYSVERPVFVEDMIRQSRSVSNVCTVNLWDYMPSNDQQFVLGYTVDRTHAEPEGLLAWVKAFYEIIEGTEGTEGTEGESPYTKDLDMSVSMQSVDVLGRRLAAINPRSTL